MATHHEVAHAWAHQTGRCRKGFNVFYEGDTIYSYGHHFPIARIVERPDGSRVVLFTTKGYSVSTAKHKSVVWRAITHLTAFEVEDVRAYSEDAYRANHEALLRDAAELVAKAKRARKYGELLLADAQRKLNTANSYASEFIRLEMPQAVTLDTLGLAVAGMEARLAEARRQREEARKEAERQRFERDRENREAWLRGDAGSRWRGTAPDGGVLGRIVGDTLETSLGAAVPLAHAVKAFRFVKLCRERGVDWHRNGKVVRVGHFQVDHIRSDGGFSAGCHTFTWQEVARLAQLAGVLGDAPSAEAVEAREYVPA